MRETASCRSKCRQMSGEKPGPALPTRLGHAHGRHKDRPPPASQAHLCPLALTRNSGLPWPVVLLAGASVAAWRVLDPDKSSNGTAIHSLAVLPFANASKDPDMGLPRRRHLSGDHQLPLPASESPKSWLEAPCHTTNRGKMTRKASGTICMSTPYWTILRLGRSLQSLTAA